ncbi:hypothetical protein PVT67_15505 [Gallaecimonas kandeliae]|uniref:hypothetical protein n=1 Tax=Gallaecimonas kandeliae TaxID=3029055 RepID=UPI002647B863|nr:hypothetical protein [Gallaecimonas kandeliae]WKE65049.1 hypothetical protein PVT67_15505 [Gallaecimonas kandeliae]
MTKTKAPETVPALDPEFVAQGAELQNQIAELRSASSEEHALMHQLLGQAQMAEAFGKFSQTVWASKLAFVKENKLYRALAGQKTPNGLELKGTWAEFCGQLGISDEKANQDIANLRAFGEEALESMSRMGIGYRELRQYRRLPEDEKTALIEVAKAGDKDAFVDLAEEIITKHSKEREQLAQERDDARADKAALDDVVADKTAKILDLEKQVSRKRLERLPPDEESQQLREEANGLFFDAEASVRRLVQPAEQVMAHAGEHGIDASHWLRGQLDQLGEALDYLREQLGMVSWQPEADSDLGGEQWAGQRSAEHE